MKYKIMQQYSLYSMFENDLFYNTWFFKNQNEYDSNSLFHYLQLIIWKLLKTKMVPFDRKVI